MLSWNQITHNPRWILEDAFKPSIENPKLTQIIENEDESVEIQFQSQSARLELPRFSTYEPASSSNSLNLQGVQFDSIIPQPFYTKEKDPTLSPTRSDMQNISHLNVISKPFSINKIDLDNDFLLNNNKLLRNKFFESFNKIEQNEIREELILQNYRNGKIKSKYIFLPMDKA